MHMIANLLGVMVFENRVYMLRIRAHYYPLTIHVASQVCVSMYEHILLTNLSNDVTIYPPHIGGHVNET